MLASSAAQALASSQAWTENDLRNVASLATENAKSRHVTANQHAAMLLKLASALNANGQPALARTITREAGALAGPPLDPGDNVQLRELIETLTELGDVQDAERAFRTSDSPILKMHIIGAIGAGYARAGDIKAAEQAALRLSAIPEKYNGPLAFSDKEWERAWIANILVMKDPAAAMRVGATLQSAFEKQHVIARAAVALCGSAEQTSPRHDLGVDAMQNAVTAYKAFTPSTKFAFAGLKDDSQEILGAGAGAAMAACVSTTEASNFLNKALSGHDAWQASWQAAKNLTYDKMYALAREIAPKPDLQDKNTVELFIHWLWDNGDHSEARALAEQAQQQLGNAKLPNGFLATDIKVGAYHAATSVVLGMNMHEQACQWPRVVTAEVQSGDISEARAVLPGLVKPLRALSGDLCSVFVRPMFVALARAGLSTAAQPNLDAYDEAYMAKPAYGKGDVAGSDIYRKAFVAGLNAGLGRLPQAIETANHAGPMTVVRNCDGPSGRSFVTCPDFEGFVALGARLSSPEVFPPDARLVVRGPKAIVLGYIASSLAESGDLVDAWKLEATLEGEPREAFREPRDKALASLATELIGRDDPKQALSVVERIASLPIKWSLLLSLAGFQTQR